MRWGCGGEPINGPVSIQVHFDQCASTVTTTCLWKMSRSEGRVTSPSEDLGSDGVSSPRALDTIRATL
jgi:hypothetical protein